MKTKFNLDRDKISRDYVHSKQDYSKVLDGFQKLKPPIWKNPWFYGPIGLASLATILVITFQSSVNAYGNNTTLKKTSKSTTILPEDTPCINAPIAGQDLAFQVIDVLPEKGKEIVLESGTHISIPANSLQGIKGEVVQIKVREFANKASAFLAGIPMDFGDNYAFESAGMIEIRAEKDGEMVQLDRSKPMDVNLALYKSPEGFQFWKLDEEKKEWIETPCLLTEKKNNSAEDKLKTVEKKLTENKKAISICDTKIETIPSLSRLNSSDQSMIPTKNARKLIVDFDQSDFPELSGYKDMEFEYILPDNRSEASLKVYGNRIKYAQSQIWNDMDIVKQKEHYLVTFINAKEKYSLPIRPVLKGKSLEEVQEKMANAFSERSAVLRKLEEEKKSYELEQAKLQKEQENLKAQFLAELKRSAEGSSAQREQEARNRTQFITNNLTVQNGTASFRTTTFGVFNCDKPIQYPPVNEQFLVFETKEGRQVQQENAFVFDLKKDTRYSFGSYYPNKLNQIGWFKNESILILIDRSGAVFFRKNINEHTKETNKVLVQQLDTKALNLDDIKNILRENPATV